MSGLHDILEELTRDRKITQNEVAVIREYIEKDGELDLEDVKFLVRLLSDAEEVCPEFDELFFPTLKQVLLEDGRIGPDERFFLLKMLYSDGHVRERERQFLLELRREMKEVCPEFESLCETADYERQASQQGHSAEPCQSRSDSSPAQSAHTARLDEVAHPVIPLRASLTIEPL